MNLFNLLTKEKTVAGLEIDDSAVRVAFFPLHPKNNFLYNKKDNEDIKQKLIVLEEPLPANVVSEGVVVNRVLLAKTIKSILTKAKLNTDYAIVAIPDDQIYLRIFSFPKTVDESRIKEAMSLSSSFQLPIKTEDVYLDWEQIKSNKSVNEVLLSAIPKTVANGYIEALNLAGVKPIALESHLSSIARAIKTDSDEATIFTKETDDDATVFLLKERTVRFSRAIPTRFISKNKFKEEVKKIKSSFEAEMSKDAKPITVVDIDSASIRDEYANLTELTEPKTKWLVALGAAIRGSIPEGADKMISLLPIKTEDAYAYHKAETFAELVRNVTIGISIFFITAFLFVYFFILSLSQNVNQSIASSSTETISSEIISKEGFINNVNSLTNTSKVILSETPTWSIFLDEIHRLSTQGIIISTLGASSLTSPISMNGTAKDRATLNMFKKTLQESPMLTDITIPITNIGQRENITFSVSFRIKEPSKLYYK